MNVFILCFFFFLVKAVTAFSESSIFVSTDYDEVAVIDGETLDLLDTIPVEQQPFGLAITPDGNLIYVANVGSDSITVLDANTYAVLETLHLKKGAAPVRIAVSPDGALLYCVNNGNNTVSVIDTTTSEMLHTIAVGSNPMGIAIHPKGRWIYITNTNENYISVIDRESHSVAQTIPHILFGTDVVFAKEGTVAYVTGFHGRIYQIDTETHGLVLEKEIEQGAGAILASADGLEIYHLNQETDTITIATDFEQKTISVSSMPLDIVMKTGGEKVFIACASGIEVFDTEQKEFLQRLSLKNSPRQLVFRPGRPLLLESQIIASLETWGQAQKNVFLAQKDRFNVVEWRLPNDLLPVSHYEIMRNGKIYARLSGDSHCMYEDHQVKKNRFYQYEITAFNKQEVIATGTIGITSTR